MQTARNACHIGGMKGRENGTIEVAIKRNTWEEVTSQDLFNLKMKGVYVPSGMKIMAIKRRV